MSNNPTFTSDGKPQPPRLLITPNMSTGLRIQFELPATTVNRPDDMVINLIQRAVKEVHASLKVCHHLEEKPGWNVDREARILTVDLGQDVTNATRVTQDICWGIDYFLSEAHAGLYTLLT